MSTDGSQRRSTRGRPRRRIIRGNVTQEETSFVGRKQDLHQLRAALGRSRLVTLAGPGGIGKSRLAREMATRHGSLFPGGIWLIELARVRSGAGVPAAVARTLGIADHGGR